MIALLAGVPLKQAAGVLQQFGGHGQVNLGVPQIDMAKINREVINKPLHILPCRYHWIRRCTAKLCRMSCNRGW